MKKTLIFLLLSGAITAHAQVSGSDWEYLAGDDSQTPFVVEQEHPEHRPGNWASVRIVEGDYISEVAPEDKMMPAIRCYEYVYLCRDKYAHTQASAPYVGHGYTDPDAVQVLHP